MKRAMIEEGWGRRVKRRTKEEGGRKRVHFKVYTCLYLVMVPSISDTTILSV